MTDAHTLIEQLQQKIHDIIAPLVPASKKFALVDFPDHGNVGDSAIWLGEIEYFRRLHDARPAYVCHKDNYDWNALERALPRGTIFIHGGGNFGDVWASHHAFREKLIERFHNHPIVQLPQTLHFSSTQALERSAEIINAHPDFILLTRDEKSYTIAREAFRCHVLLCPDSAYMIGSCDRRIPPAHKLLMLLRTDHEKQDATLPQELPDGTLVADWLQDAPDLKSAARNQTLLQLGFAVLNHQRRREQFYRNLSQSRVERGLKLLSSAEYVITDRLHTHILSTLLNIPHTILDNNYGKVSSFARLWSKGLDILRSSTTPEHALADYVKRRAESA